jgi:hypothetical protein
MDRLEMSKVVLVPVPIPGPKFFEGEVVGTWSLCGCDRVKSLHVEVENWKYTQTPTLTLKISIK